MKNNNITVKTRRYHKYKSPWQNKIGVFETPRGKWIVRIIQNNRPSTISQHETEEEALFKYNNLNK